MTKEQFCAAALAELRATHPGLETGAADVFVGHAHDLLLDALGCPALERSDLPLAEELAVWRYNRAGSEGVRNETMSGISQTFSEELPKALRRAILRRRKVRWS